MGLEDPPFNNESWKLGKRRQEENRLCCSELLPPIPALPASLCLLTSYLQAHALRLE